MKINRDMNEQGSLRTRRSNGVILCVYSGNKLQGDVAISVSSCNVSENVWLDISKVDEFVEMVEINRDNIDSGGFYIEKINNKIKIINKEKTSEPNFCDYCGEKHNFQDDYNILILDEAEHNITDRVSIYGSCIDDFLSCLKNLPQDIKSFNSLENI